MNRRLCKQSASALHLHGDRSDPIFSVMARGASHLQRPLPSVAEMRESETSSKAAMVRSVEPRKNVSTTRRETFFAFNT